MFYSHFFHLWQPAQHFGLLSHPIVEASLKQWFFGTPNCLNAVSYLNYRSEWRVHLVSSGIYQNSFPPQLVSRIWSVPPLPLQIAPIAPFPAYFQFPAKKHAWKSLLNAEPNTRERRRSSQPSRKAPMFYLLNMSNLVYDRIWRSWINRRGKGGNYESHYTDVCLDRQW